MAKLNVRTDIINILYNSTIGGVLRYCVVAWCGNAKNADMECIDSIIRKVSKVIRMPQPNIDSMIYISYVPIKVNKFSLRLTA